MNRDDPPEREPQCEICGFEGGSCICPECPLCGEAGSIACYMPPLDHLDFNDTQIKSNQDHQPLPVVIVSATVFVLMTSNPKVSGIIKFRDKDTHEEFWTELRSLYQGMKSREPERQAVEEWIEDFHAEK